MHTGELLEVVIAADELAVRELEPPLHTRKLLEPAALGELGAVLERAVRRMAALSHSPNR